MPNSRHSQLLLFLFLFTLGIRIVYGGILLSLFDLNPTAEYYDKIARNLVLGHGYTEDPAAGPNLWRAPLYPFVLAGLYSLFGFSNLPVIALQMLFDALTGVIVYLIADRTFDSWVALVSAVATALYPFFSYYTLRVFSESLFTLLLALFTWSLLRAYRSLAPGDFVLAGFTLGLALLCKPVLGLFPLLVPVGLFSVASTTPRSRLLTLSFILVVTALLVVLPWSLRNYHVTGRIIPIGIGGGYNFWLSNHLPTGGLDDDQLDSAGQGLLDEATTRIIGDGGRAMTPDNDHKFLRKAYKELLESPGGFFALQFRKLFRFWFSTFNPTNRHLDRILLAIQLPILGLAGVGVLGSAQARRSVFPLLLIVAYFMVVNTLVPVTTFRYAIPIMPYVLVLAAFGTKVLASGGPGSRPLSGAARLLTR